MSFFDPASSRLKNAGESYSYSETADGEMRFEVRGGDHYANPNAAPADQDAALGKNRSEIGTFKHMQWGREFTYDFDFLVESGAANTADWLVLAQFHQTEDVDETGAVIDGAASPPFSMTLRGERLEFSGRTDPDPITETTPPDLTLPPYDTPQTNALYLDSDPLPRDTWINIRIEVVFDHRVDGDGRLKIWRDGTLIVDYDGPLGYNDEIGPYLQMGVYRAEAPETTAARFRNLTVTADGAPPPMEGTAGDDDIDAGMIGFWEDETLYGYGGDDTLAGGVGADTLYGGAGNDTYVVDEAGDVVDERDGGADAGGIDTVRATLSWTLGADIEHLALWGTDDIDGTGNAGANDLTGNAGSNVLLGLGGADHLFGGAGDDTLDGGAGADELFGATGTDILRGGDGHDRLHGEAGDDTLYGGAGNDTLEGDAGNDRMEGGAGDDAYVVEQAGDTVIEAAGGGTDTVRTTVSFDAGAGNHVEILNTTDQSGTADIDIWATDGANQVRGNEGDNRLGGRGGDDLIKGFGGADELFGGAGDDSLFGGAGGDTLHGGSGADALYGETEGDTLYGGVGTDALYGRAGDDLIEGGSDDDRLFGGDGADTMRGGTGADRLEGGAGLDVLDGGAGDDSHVVEEAGDVVIERAGEGVDTVRALGSWDAGAGNHVEIINAFDAAGTQALDLAGTDGNNEIRGNDGTNLLTGRGGDDALFGYAGGDTLLGDAGADRLYGGAGVDALTGGDGDDVLFGGADADDLRGGTGADAFYGGGGADALRGETGADTLWGGAGDDTLWGGDDVDRLYGDAGNDALTGGAGDDALFGGADADDLRGGTGADALYGGDGADRLHGETWADTLWGGAGDDTLWGGADADRLYGDAGADTLAGGGGDDTLFGGGDADDLQGGDGHDTLYSGSGAGDRMAGGAGDDTYYVDAAGVTVTEAAGQGTDTVRTSLSFALAAAAEVEVLRVADQSTTGALDLTGSDIANEIRGNAGANVIDGGAGADRMYGYGGDDTYIVDDAADRVYDYAGGGRDTVIARVDFSLSSTQIIEVLRSGGTDLSLGGNDGANEITGDAGANWLRGRGGDDTLTGGAGDDTIYGGDGTDTFVLDVASDAARATAGGSAMLIETAEGTDFVSDDVEFVRFTDRTLSYAEAAALDGTPDTPPTEVRGTEASENLAGTAGTDLIVAGGGWDWITPNTGSDLVDGGDGRDMVSFYDLPDIAGRTHQQFRLDIDLGGGWAVCSEGLDQYALTAVERVTGTVFADRIKGDAGDNELRGLGDYDWFVATTGADIYDGGTGQDMVSYVDWLNDAPNTGDIFSADGAPPGGGTVTGVVVDLADPGNNTNLAAGHSYVDIERVTGSGRQDVFWGDGSSNDFRGLGDYDWFVGSTGGRERYFGGDGLDTVTYFRSEAGVTAGLGNGALVGGEETGRGIGGDAAMDLYFSIENLVGTGFADSLAGNSGRNCLSGLDGDDLLFGYGGIDRLKGGAGDDVLYGGGASDYALFEGSVDDYSLVRTAGDRVTVTWTGEGAGSGTDRLIDVEYMVFDDAEVSIWDLG